MARGTPPFTTCQLASHVPVKMTSNGVLKTFWPLLKVLQFLGACPIQKDENSPCGFKALTFLNHLTRVLLASLLGIAIYTGVFAYLYSIEGISITDVNEIMFHFARALLTEACTSTRRHATRRRELGDDRADRRGVEPRRLGVVTRDRRRERGAARARCRWRQSARAA